jgi:hypothetical protein
MKAEMYTPPASSPESSATSPIRPTFEHNNFRQTPDALGIFEYSSSEHPVLRCPVTPPMNDHWTTQAESATSSSLSLGALSLGNQAAPWTSAGYSDVQAVVTSSVAWETPGAYVPHFADSNYVHCAADRYSPYPAPTTHDLPLQHPSLYSPYASGDYEVDNERVQSPPCVGSNPYSVESTSHSTPYLAAATHQFALASVRTEEDHLHSSEVPVAMSSVSQAALDQFRNPTNFILPLPLSSTETADPMAQVARVRNRRRRTLTPSTALITCPVCKHAFDRTYNFREHMKTHDQNRERRFRCDFPGCKRKLPFFRSHDLDRHVNCVSFGLFRGFVNANMAIEA